MDNGYEGEDEIMDINILHSQLKAKQLSGFYIFTGVEWIVQQKYIEQICKVAGKEKKYIDAFEDIYRTLINKSLLSKKYVYIVRDDKDLMTDEKLQGQLQNILGENILILLVTALDKRTKFSKTYKDIICEFEALKPELLRKYIQKEIPLTDKATDKLMEVCENDYGRCLLEIDKIKHYLNGVDPTGDDLTWDKGLKNLLADKTIYTPPKDAIFDFIDSILDRNLDSVFDLYNQCRAVGEATMVMISVLYNNAKAVLQVQLCESKDVGKSTGLTGWQIMNAKKHLNKYTADELIDIMRLCQWCESGIKTGKIEEGYAMEYIMVNVL